MRHSDALTRGPWRKRWLNYIRNLDILDVMEKSLDNCPDAASIQIIEQAMALQAGIIMELRKEIRDALTVGAYGVDETDPEEDRLGPAGRALHSRLSLRLSEAERDQPDHEVQEQLEKQPPFAHLGGFVPGVQPFPGTTRRPRTGQ